MDCYKKNIQCGSIIKGQNFFEKYELCDQKLGESNNKVFTAVNKENKTQIHAVKIIKLEQYYFLFIFDHGEQEENVINEIKIMEQLQKNQFVIKYQDFCIIEHKVDEYVSNKYAYILMEKGEMDLNALIRNRKEKMQFFDTPLIINFIKNMIKCLSDIQKENIQHCDIKPSNIIVFNSSQLECKICDVGSGNTVILNESTILKNIKGTEQWMAPELIQILKNQNYFEKTECKYNSFKSDVFSLGLCIVYLITFQLMDGDQRLYLSQELQQEIIEELLIKCKEKLKNFINYYRLIEEMVKFDKNERKTFVELENFLNAFENSEIKMPNSKRQIQIPNISVIKPQDQFDNENTQIDKPKLQMQEIDNKNNSKYQISRNNKLKIQIIKQNQKMSENEQAQSSQSRSSSKTLIQTQQQQLQRTSYNNSKSPFKFSIKDVKQNITQNNHQLQIKPVKVLSMSPDILNNKQNYLQSPLKNKNLPTQSKMLSYSPQIKNSQQNFLPMIIGNKRIINSPLLKKTEIDIKELSASLPKNYQQQSPLLQKPNIKQTKPSIFAQQKKDLLQTQQYQQYNNKLNQQEQQSFFQSLDSKSYKIQLQPIQQDQNQIRNDLKQISLPPQQRNINIKNNSLLIEHEQQDNQKNNNSQFQFSKFSYPYFQLQIPFKCADDILQLVQYVGEYKSFTICLIFGKNLKNNQKISQNFFNVIEQSNEQSNFHLIFKTDQIDNLQLFRIELKQYKNKEKLQQLFHSTIKSLTLKLIQIKFEQSQIQKFAKFISMFENFQQLNLIFLSCEFFITDSDQIFTNCRQSSLNKIEKLTFSIENSQQLQEKFVQSFIIQARALQQLQSFDLFLRQNNLKTDILTFLNNGFLENYKELRNLFIDLSLNKLITLKFLNNKDFNFFIPKQVTSLTLNFELVNLFECSENFLSIINNILSLQALESLNLNFSQSQLNKIDLINMIDQISIKLQNLSKFSLELRELSLNYDDLQQLINIFTKANLSFLQLDLSYNNNLFLKEIKLSISNIMSSFKHQNSPEQLSLQVKEILQRLLVEIPKSNLRIKQYNLILPRQFSVKYLNEIVQRDLLTRIESVNQFQSLDFNSVSIYFKFKTQNSLIQENFIQNEKMQDKSDQICCSQLNNNQFLTQMYYCLTCCSQEFEQQKAICQNCISFCHSEHEYIQIANTSSDLQCSCIFLELCKYNLSISDVCSNFIKNYKYFPLQRLKYKILNDSYIYSLSNNNVQNLEICYYCSKNCYNDKLFVQKGYGNFICKCEHCKVL